MFKSLLSLKHRVLLLMCFVLLSSCSMRQLIVRNIDYFLMREMDSYFDLTSEQYDIYRKKGGVHLEWFKQTQIPWIKTEVEIIRMAKEPLPPEFLRSVAEEKFKKAWIAVCDRMAADAAVLFHSLTPAQLEHFEERLIEKSKLFSKLVELPPDDYLEEYRDIQDDGLDRMSDWVGSVTDEQKAMFLKLTFVGQEQYRQEAAIWIEIRTAFISQLKQKIKQGGVEDFLKKWARHPDIDGQKYAQYRKWRLSRQIDVWVAMEKTITPKQRSYRSEQMLQVISDLNTMLETNYSPSEK
ncbi:MAG: hypothetical protein CMP10_01610 [Zetaproteobacteria bacterium]|nr:hypothetical protein [Pseudobdellovibrionaceae bacterium]